MPIRQGKSLFQLLIGFQLFAGCKVDISIFFYIINIEIQIRVRGNKSIVMLNALSKLFSYRRNVIRLIKKHIAIKNTSTKMDVIVALSAQTGDKGLGKLRCRTVIALFGKR